MASETKTNGNVGYMPAPNSYGSPPGDTQSSSYAFQQFLLPFRFFASINSVIYLCALVVMAWNFGNIGADTWTCSIREFDWTYVRYFGNAINVVGAFAGYWILYHLLFGAWYLAAFVACLLNAAWILTTVVFFTLDASNCKTTIPCIGCGTLHTDWAFILNFATVGAMLGCNILSLIVVVVLRRHANWALYWDVAAETSTDPTTTQVAFGTGPFSNLPAWLGGGNPYVSGGYVAMAQSKLVGDSISGKTQTTRSRAVGSHKDMVVSSPVAREILTPGAMASGAGLMAMAYKAKQ
jgi:hypothetical protein